MCLLVAAAGSNYIASYKYIPKKAINNQMLMIGCTPGVMPSRTGEKLNARGVTTMNKKADVTGVIDARLISGASPKAANAFGRLAATNLLEMLKTNPTAQERSHVEP